MTRVDKPKKGSMKWSLIKNGTPVGVSAEVRDSIVAKLQDKKYRDAFVKSHLVHGLAHQIRTNREYRGLSQAAFAKKCGPKTKQATISRLEDPAYGNYSINTLLSIASALDVALLVKLVPYSKFLLETADKTEPGLVAQSFEDENLYLRQALVTLTLEEQNAYLKPDKASYSELGVEQYNSITMSSSGNNSFIKSLYLGSKK